MYIYLHDAGMGKLTMLLMRIAGGLLLWLLVRVEGCWWGLWFIVGDVVADVVDVAVIVEVADFVVVVAVAVVLL